MMGGRIWVESEPGEGARFIFTAKMPNTAKNLRSLLRPGVNWESVRVLVVDSSPSARRQFKEAFGRLGVECATFKEAFDRLGVECATVEDSVAAHEMISEQTGFDVYFIDLRATGINGIGFTVWLRSRGERSAIILTSDSDWESLQEAVLRSGADKGLIKPILSSALIDCMNECLGNILVVVQQYAEAQRFGTDGYDARIFVRRNRDIIAARHGDGVIRMRRYDNVIA